MSEVILYHGWGFDQTCWRVWQAKLEQQGCLVQCFDRGYWGQPHQPVFSSLDRPKILLAHSLGLHFCPLSQLQQADVLVLFNSFLQFHPDQHPMRRRSQQRLQVMIQQFSQQPQVVLDNFYANCDYPIAGLGTRDRMADFTLLLEDLHRLDQAEMTADCLKSIPEILLIQSQADRIVWPAQGKTMFELLQQQSQWIEIQAAGHALPFSHFSACWPWMQAILQRMVTDETDGEVDG
jgi:pimeloyl-[acyl-carrier protein] methyl ester esterase